MYWGESNGLILIWCKQAFTMLEEQYFVLRIFMFFTHKLQVQVRLTCMQHFKQNWDSPVSSIYTGLYKCSKHVVTWYIVMCVWNIIESSLSLGQDQFLLGKNVWILSIILYVNLNLLQTCFEVLNLVMSVKKKDIAKCLRIEVVLMLHTVVLCQCWADVK